MKKTIFFLLCAALLSSCATVFSGVKCKVRVTDGQPVAAKVYLNGNYINTAPCTVVLSKNALRGGNSIIEIKADGYQVQKITLAPKVKLAAIVGDLFFTMGVGLIIDFVDGAIYKAYPSEVKYSLDKAP